MLFDVTRGENHADFGGDLSRHLVGQNNHRDSTVDLVEELCQRSCWRQICCPKNIVHEAEDGEVEIAVLHSWSLPFWVGHDVSLMAFPMDRSVHSGTLHRGRNRLHPGYRQP